MFAGRAQKRDLAVCLGEKSKVFSFFLTMHEKQEGSPSSITMHVQKKKKEQLKEE